MQKKSDNVCLICNKNSLYSQSSCCLHALVCKYCLLHSLIPLMNRQSVQINSSSLKARYIVKSLFTSDMCHCLISLISVWYLLLQVPVPMSVKGRIILEILEGMAYLMGNQVIHKDLKPENILVDKNFHIKV